MAAVSYIGVYEMQAVYPTHPCKVLTLRKAQITFNAENLAQDSALHMLEHSRAKAGSLFWHSHLAVAVTSYINDVFSFEHSYALSQLHRPDSNCWLALLWFGSTFKLSGLLSSRITLVIKGLWFLNWTTTIHVGKSCVSL